MTHVFHKPRHLMFCIMGHVWITKLTKGGERHERSFACFAPFRGLRGPNPHPSTSTVLVVYMASWDLATSPRLADGRDELQPHYRANGVEGQVHTDWCAATQRHWGQGKP